MGRRVMQRPFYVEELRKRICIVKLSSKECQRDKEQ